METGFKQSIVLALWSTETALKTGALPPCFPSTTNVPLDVQFSLQNQLARLSVELRDPMSYRVTAPQGWHPSQQNPLPPTFHQLGSVWNIPQTVLPPFLSRRRASNPNPEPQTNPFATGSLIEALAEPASASRHTPARPIRPRKGTHKRQSSSGSTRHPAAASRNEEAARAASVAAMRQALSVQQGPIRRTPLDTPRASVRQPLVAARQPGDVRSVVVRPQQLEAPVVPEGRVIQRGRRTAAMYPAVPVHGQGREIYQTLQPMPSRYGRGARSARDVRF
ncbi:hypothetical protein B0H16DRAFT_1686470 [Mycena metata]|uniref:Uncharacterized protein n=1 Tax=Mycena metata TaxID=1033252 RepID=A0AAD7JQA3_9AGAR|nr:hypothetical protein B0H16DRAFT_1686470 [Mycena metata]